MSKLYYKTQLDTTVSILPSQISADLDKHIIENLTSKVKLKTTEYGIIMKIYRLIDYGYGLIDGTNLTGSIVYNVKYECILCHPEQNLEIVCVIDNIIKGYILGSNGPITTAIRINTIDTNTFNVNNDIITHKKSGKKIEKKSFIKVSIINKKSDLGEETIIATCKLLELATDAEIKHYNNDIDMIYNDNDDNNVEFI